MRGVRPELVGNGGSSKGGSDVDPDKNEAVMPSKWRLRQTPHLQVLLPS